MPPKLEKALEEKESTSASPTEERVKYMDLLKSLPKYDQSNAFQNWRNQLLAVVTVLSRFDETVCSTVTKLLPLLVVKTDADNQAAIQISGRNPDLNEALDSLEALIAPTKSVHDSLEEFWSIKYRRDEDLHEYLFKLERTGTRAGVNRKVIAFQFANGLPQPIKAVTLDYIRRMMPDIPGAEDLEKMCAEANAQVRMNRPEETTSHDTTRVFQLQEPKVCMTTRRPSLPINRNFAANSVPEVNSRWRNNSPGSASGYRRNTVYEGRRSRGGINNRCYCCNSADHFLRNCPYKHCPACGGQGHIPGTRECRSRCNQSNVVFPDGADLVSCAIEIPCQIGGKQYNALIDTGSGPNILDISAAEEIGKFSKINRTKTPPVYGIKGDPVDVLYTLEAELLIAKESRTTTFKVINTKMDTPLLILGRELLSQYRTTSFDWEANRICLDGDWVPAATTMIGGSVLGRAQCSEGLEGQVLSPEYDINPVLPKEWLKRISDVLETYQHVFAENPRAPGITPTAEHTIQTGDAPPVRQKMWRHSPQETEEINQQVNEMLQNGICRHSISDWRSNVILVQKKDKTKRFVVDYRKLNEVTVKDTYPIPSLKDVIDRMYGSEIYSTLDCASGYWQIPVKEKDKKKTAFATPRGLFEMNVMPFGLCNSQASWQRALDSALKKVKRTESYIDDCIVFSHNLEKHVKDLEQCLLSLSEANFKLKKAKCHFGYYEVEFVGHMLSKAGVRPKDDHVKAIKEFPVPSDVKQLKRFLGFVGYYQEHIRKFSEIASPLYELTKANTEWSWKTEQQNAFNFLRDALCSQPILAYPNWEKPFYVEADASGVAVGAILSQDSENGHRRPIAFFSSSLNESQRNYSARELECWALIASSRKWRNILRGAREVLLLTDHCPLQWMKKQLDPRRKFARWLTELEELKYKIMARSGKTNAPADALSRIENQKFDFEVNNEDIYENKIYQVETISGKPDSMLTIKLMQQADEAIHFAIQQISDNGAIKQGRYKRFPNMCMINQVLCKGNRIVLPQPLREQVIHQVHQAGHFGIKKTTDAMKEKYFWIGLSKSVKRMLARCKVCLETKSKRPTPRESLQPIELEEMEPRTTVAMDIATLPLTPRGNRYALVIVDCFSKFTEIVPLANQNAQTVTQAFYRRWILRHGAPKVLVTDQGKNVDGSLVRNLCETFSINKRHSSPYHPEGDGTAERTIQTAKQVLRALITERKLPQSVWDMLLEETQFYLNSAKHCATKISANEIMYGVQLHLPQAPKVDNEEENIQKDEMMEELQERLAQIKEIVGKELENARVRMRNQFDKSAHPQQIIAGDNVLLKNERKRGLSNPYKGEWTVVEKIGAKNVKIKKRNASKQKVVHINKIYPLPADQEEEIDVSNSNVYDDKRRQGCETQVGDSSGGEDEYFTNEEQVSSSQIADPGELEVNSQVAGSQVEDIVQCRRSQRLRNKLRKKDYIYDDDEQYYMDYE